MRATSATSALLLVLAHPVSAQTASEGEAPSPPAVSPVEQADDRPWKATGSLYLLPEDRNEDLNLKREVSNVGAWVGVFHDPQTVTVARVGGELDWHAGPALVVPTVQAATNGLKAGQFYAELGGKTYAIVGASRTNLRPFYNLSFDPNESVQLGLGRHLSRFDKVYAFTIFDVRLHTGQQNTHVLWRHRLSPTTGLTWDALYKSGEIDSGRTVHAVGLGAYLDRSRWFLKAYFDPYVNFTAASMVRLGLGAKF
jgi:hypothetical protein